MPTYEELVAQANRMMEEAYALREEEKKKAIEDIRATMERLDISITEISRVAAVGAKDSRYRKAIEANPDVWPGRGKPPQWFLDAQKERQKQASAKEQGDQAGTPPKD